jgi:hypothetical protein
MKIREILENTQRPNLNDAFRRWFAGSKVVDAKGNPLIVYHGTNQTIDKFATRRLGANTGTVSSKAFFFTEHPAEAGEYAALSARRQVSNAEEREEKAAYFQREINRAYARNDFDRAEKLTLEYEASEQEVFDGHDIGANILPVYLSVKNPFVFDMEGKDLYALSAAIDHAKTNGYDGMHLKNVFDPVDDRPEAFNTIQWIVFKPTQIKSIFNRGTWNGRSAKLSEMLRS